MCTSARCNASRMRQSRSPAPRLLPWMAGSMRTGKGLATSVMHTHRTTGRARARLGKRRRLGGRGPRLADAGTGCLAC